jgi:large subunit ribosomal protein L23
MKEIILIPHITEKAMKSRDLNQYVFEVNKEANKTEIKKEVERRYKVKVIDVKIINLPGKKKRYLRKISKMSGLKKAIVKLKKGDKIATEI